MKKKAIFLLTLLATLSCERATPERVGGLTLTFTPAPYTKSAEFTGTELSSHSKLLLTACLKNADGRIHTPSLFMEGNEPAAQRLTKDGSQWKVTGEELILPFGGMMMDVIVFGTDSDEDKDLNAFGSSVWVPGLNSSDAASTVTFTDIDTYSNQMDVMYAAASGITAASSTLTLTLRHAMAQLVFNVKFTGDDMAFIETNGTTYKFKIDDILFEDAAGNPLLQTQGTFTIDNRGNTLKAAWSDLSVLTSNKALPMNPSGRSAINTGAESAPVFSNTEESWKTDGITRETKVYQVGEPLLVPEQASVNPVVLYTYGGYQYRSTLNLPRTHWESGHSYIYTLVFSKITDKIGFTVTVNDMEYEYGGEI